MKAENISLTSAIAEIMLDCAKCNVAFSDKQIREFFSCQSYLTTKKENIILIIKDDSINVITDIWSYKSSSPNAMIYTIKVINEAICNIVKI